MQFPMGDSKPITASGMAAHMSERKTCLMSRATTYTNHAEDPLARALALLGRRAAVPAGYAPLGGRFSEPAPNDRCPVCRRSRTYRCQSLHQRRHLSLLTDSGTIEPH